MKRKTVNFNFFRLIFQLSIIGILLVLAYDFYVQMNYVDFEAYCPFGGIQALASFIENDSLACSMTSEQISMGILLFVAIVLFSKLFCSYICPVGTVTEYISRLGRKVNLNFTPSGYLDKGLRIIKYALLVVVFYFTLETSELFCKLFDPFYAIATGFNSDVNVWMAITSIAAVVIGSFFIRMFWCKYACPLGALSNIFKFSWSFVIFLLIYVILLWVGLKISLFWFVAAIALFGYLQEIFNFKSGRFHVIKVIKNEDTCINCKKCDKSCPQGINVSEYTKVNHIDCNMCNECISACPVSNTIGVNQTKRKFTWLPAAIIALLIFIGVIAGKQFELPTVNIYWGDEFQKEYAETFAMDGLRDVKCYGSSMSFVEQMKQVPGVVGAATYVGKNSVRVVYDPNLTTGAKIKEAIFKPSQMLNVEPSLDIDSLSIVKLEVNNFFDAYDTYFMNILLSQYDKNIIYGYESMYGEPVKLNLYIHELNVSLDDIKEFIEKDQVTFLEEGIEYTEDINFEVVSIELTNQKVSRLDFMLKMFKSYDATCNNYENYNKEDIGSFRVRISGYMKNQQWGAHLRNDVARNDTGIVRLKTYYASEFPVAEIEYVNSVTNPENIWKNITKDTLSVTYTNGYVQTLKNPFKFEKIESQELINNLEKNE